MIRDRARRLACLALLALAAPGTAQEELVVFAAASLRDVLEEHAVRFAAAHGRPVRLSLASSSTLAKQIENGARPAVYLTADPAWARHLIERARLDPAHAFEIARNRLVLARSSRAAVGPLAWHRDAAVETAFAGRFALADPAHVPAGRYARQALESIGWWRRLLPRMRFGQDVRQALRDLEIGECDLGIVYASDVRAAPGVETVLEIPAAAHDPIVYVAAVLAGEDGGARTYLDDLAADEDLWRRYGFLPGRRAFDAETAATPPPPGGLEIGPAIRLSLQVGAASVLLCLPPALAVAWFLARRRTLLHPVIDALCHLPLVLPPVVTGYLLLLLFGRSTAVGSFFAEHLGLSLSATWHGAALAAAIVAFPLVLRAVRLSMEAIDPRLESCARSLGASEWRVFRTVTLPLAVPGILSGSLLAFARSLGEFGATITFVGNTPGETRTLPLLIYTETQIVGRDERVLILALCSVLVSFLALLVGERLAAGERARRKAS